MKNKKLLGILLIAYGLFGLIASVFDLFTYGIGFRMNNCLSAILGITFIALSFSFFRKIRRKKYFDNFERRLS